ncbi:translin [Anaeramoeba flamelloides]|uniref:Translin n=1 Tax=Anaeramoeba flamelloides TaxID=1746091 RepID=A0AAV7Z0V6_9EUKA|nr:translin [Anaeramoeba flamelloides]
MNKIFQDFQNEFNEEFELKQKIRTQTKQITKINQKIEHVLIDIHDEFDDFSNIFEKILNLIPKFKEQLEKVVLLIPEEQYHKYDSGLKFEIINIIYALSFVTFLKSGDLITIQKIKELILNKEKLGLKYELIIEKQDYLNGISKLSSQLSRYCVNCARNEKYEIIENICDFLGKINLGLELLKSKNEGLKKKHEFIKRDLKKIEKLIYDIEKTNQIKKILSNQKN